MSTTPGGAGEAPEKSDTPVTESGSKSEQTTSVPHVDVPDPDEDDLDDLDDMLDDFSIAQAEEKKSAAPSGPGRPKTVEEIAAELPDDEFAKQLQAGMADLLGELETDPDMQAQFASMLKELGGEAIPAEVAKDTATAAQAGSSSTRKASVSGGEESFQETIKKTMERMQASGEKATQAATEDDTGDFLAEMMKAMQSGGLDGEGSEEDFSKMLLGMMEQLTNKDILYEPMKELDEKYPAWMEKNKDSTSAEDMTRYKEQQTVVEEIVKRFELSTYSDSNAADREYIVDRMQKMQAAGSPPADLVGDMAAAQEAFGAPEEGCPQQ